MGKTRKMYTSSGWISGSDPTGCRKQRKWWESNSSEKEQMIPIHILWILIHVYSIMMNISMYGIVIQLLYVYGVQNVPLKWAVAKENILKHWASWSRIYSSCMIQSESKEVPPTADSSGIGSKEAHPEKLVMFECGLHYSMTNFDLQ